MAVKSVFLLRDPEGPEEIRLVAQFEAVSKNIHEAVSGLTGNEQAYSIAYQRLVMHGLAQQIKKKFR